MCRYIKKTMVYPINMKNQKISGTTVVQALVKADSTLEDIHVVSTSGYQELDDEALRIVKSFPKIVPATQSCEPIDFIVQIPVVFSIEEEVKPYEDKTILEYHQLISSVLSMAEEEMIVPYNAASKAKPPRAKQKEVNFFSPDTIKRIKLAFDQEPLKWRVMGYLLVYTGGRRGEVLGLKWEHIDFKRNRIHIVNNSLYSADIGIYEETPKTKKSTRWISMPVFVMDLLKEYKAWQEQEAERLAGYWQESGYVLTKDNGQPMHPDSVSDRLKKIEEKYSLPHLNAHAFRHSYVSALIFAGVDTVSIAASVGHSKTSTTENIYGHVFAEAEERNAAVIESVYD